MKNSDLKKLLDDNPQVDIELLKKALEEAKGIQKASGTMFNFDMIVPYASDTPSHLFDKAWAENQSEY